MIIDYTLKRLEDNAIIWEDSGRNYFESVLDPILIAHDILEHPIRSQNDSIYDELLAFGAYYWVRIHNDLPGYDHYITANLNNLLYLIPLDYTFKTKSIKPKEQYLEVWSDFTKIVQKALDRYNKDPLANNVFNFIDGTLSELSNYLIQSLYKGYVRCVNRYKKYNPLDIEGLLYIKIPSLINKWLDNTNYMKALLTINYDNLNLEMNYIESQ